MPELEPSGGVPAISFETKGDRSKGPLALLHGFTGTRRTWDRVSGLLAAGRFLILPDLPGHGMSGASSSTQAMGVRATADSIAEVIRLASGGRKTALLGYSLGGRVALDLACRHQDMLSCLILEGASAGIEDEGERKERAQSDRALADEIERRGLEWFVDTWQQNPLFRTQEDLPRPVVEAIRSDRLSNSAHGLAMSLRAAGTGEMSPLWTALEGLDIPVLMIVGKKDAKYAATGDAMRRKVPGSLLVQVEGAGHCVHVERPTEFADEVERFLAGLGSAPTRREARGVRV